MKFPRQRFLADQQQRDITWWLHVALMLELDHGNILGPQRAMCPLDSLTSDP